MAANADGGGEQQLAARKPPDFFSGAPAWSPDGGVIVCGVRTTASSTPATVVEVPAGGGAERPLTSHRWGDIGRVLWLRDGSGLVLSAEPELTSQGMQLWHLSYPEGAVRRITNDLNAYGTFSLGLTADDNTLVTVQTEVIAQICVTAPHEDENRARKLSDRKYEGKFGLAWTPDGKIVYSTQVGHSQNFWLMNADGTGNKQLTADASAKQDVAVSPDGRYLVFQSNRAGTWSLWRTDADGGNPKQLTNGDDKQPAFSPDGRWVVFVSTWSGKWTLWKVGIEGGAPIQITDSASGLPAVSPDGKLIAYLYPDEQARYPHRVALIPFEGGQPVKRFDLPSVAPGSGLRWTPDGRALLYVDTRNNVSNVWSQPVDGGKPVQLTNFKTLGIDAYDLSPDGRHLVCSRWTSNSDVVLVKDFR
jgi:Tol biopolymer transport system component